MKDNSISLFWINAYYETVDAICAEIEDEWYENVDEGDGLADYIDSYVTWMMIQPVYAEQLRLVKDGSYCKAAKEVYDRLVAELG